MNPSPEPSVAPCIPQPCGVWSSQLQARPAVSPRWLWHGYLAAGHTTLLTSQWKAGKTTLLAVLLAKRAVGGHLAGRAVAPGKTAVVSEEALDLWVQRSQRLGFGNAACFFCRPFRGRPSADEWRGLIDTLAGLIAEHAVDLVVIDTLARFLPGAAESSAALMLDALAPLQDLTARGAAVLVLHHPRKGALRDGQAARGTGALPAHVDVIIEMNCPRKAAPGDRRRLLSGHARFDETPRHLVVALNDAGTDYEALDGLDPGAVLEGWDELEAVLADAVRKLTAAEIRQTWTGGEKPPSRATLYRWLERAADAGAVCRDGDGRRRPHRYWLAAREAEWRGDPVQFFEAQFQLASDLARDLIE